MQFYCHPELNWTIWRKMSGGKKICLVLLMFPCMHNCTFIDSWTSCMDALYGSIRVLLPETFISIVLFLLFRLFFFSSLLSFLLLLFFSCKSFCRLFKDELKGRSAQFIHCIRTENAFVYVFRLFHALFNKIFTIFFWVQIFIFIFFFWQMFTVHSSHINRRTRKSVASIEVKRLLFEIGYAEITDETIEKTIKI